MPECLLHFVRHGQTAWNAERRLQGQVDVPLNEIGIAEAENVALEYKDHRFAAVYSSPLKRAHETCRIVNQHHGHEIKFHDSLKEATYGSIEGIYIDDYHKKCAEQNYNELSYREKIHFKMVPDAESYFEIYARVKPLLDEIILHHLGKEVLIVTHGGLMKSVIAMIGDIDVREITIPNGGSMILAGDGSKLSIQHLKRIKIGNKA